MEYLSTSKETKDLSIIIYDGRFGCIKETRAINSAQEYDYINFTDIPEQIDVDSFMAEELEIQEMHFEYDLSSKEKLLGKYIGKDVILYNKKQNTKESYLLLSIQDNIILENNNTKEIIINPEDEMLFPKSIEPIQVKPVLIMKIKPLILNELKASYTTKNISWNAKYTLYLKDNDNLDLRCFVNIKNGSGTTYKNALIKLLEGDEKQSTSHEVGRLFDNNMYDFASIPSYLVEKEFYDYHLYTLEGGRTLKNNQSKQISFLNVKNVNYKKFYEYNPMNNSLSINIEFENNKENMLGMALPKGEVKVYIEDTAGTNLKTTKDSFMVHSPKDEKITLDIGNSYEIVCSNKEIERYEEEDGDKYISIQHIISNLKNEKVIVKFNARIGVKNWSIVWHTDQFEVMDSNYLVFWVEIEPNSQKIIKYQYKLNDNKI